MKNLILIRHAKSSWDSPMQDFDRPLEHCGILDADRVSTEFKKYLPTSFVVFSSPAKRARETALIFAKNLLYPLESIIFSDNLYTFDENKLEKTIQLISNDYENVILLGHNDAITNFVNKFGTIFIDNVPTAGLIWLQFESDHWEKIQKGKTLKTLFPKNLK
ncbi:MAG TPA: histidine phosphatase family protein [Flavobacterium sp.]|nr:histidine phosphatase family protein [Flavobacterium sp.]HAT76013.1 histidine phosphatase family protein [Flavobacterium sp.]HAT81542.1 histidine phosphatase family protein [Flavobacterium sp.]